MPATAEPVTDAQVQLDIEVPEVEVVPDPPAVYEPDAELLDTLVEATRQNVCTYWYHHDAEAIVDCIVDTHQEQLLAWGGFNYHCPIPLQHDGLTGPERHVIEVQDAELRQAAEALRYTQGDEVFVPALCAFNNVGHCVGDHGVALFKHRCGDELFEQCRAPEDKRRKKELTLQVGMLNRKLDPISAMQTVASNMYDRPTESGIRKQMERCAYWREGAYCTCSACTDSRQRSNRRVTAQWREGQPVNRVIRNAYRKGGFPETFLSTVDNHMAALGEVWSRQDRSLYVTVSCHPSAYLHLGNRNFTKGDGSCYRDGGEWEGAKHALMLAPNSCVFYFYRSDQFDVDHDPNELQAEMPIARAWGYWTPGQLIACANFYGLPQRELRTAMAMVVEAELGRAAAAVRLGSPTTTAFFSAMKYYQYLNSDSMLWSKGPRQTKRVRLAAAKAVNDHMGPRDICKMREREYDGQSYDEHGADLDWVNITDIDAEMVAAAAEAIRLSGAPPVSTTATL